jgi:hypothetical protein
MTGCDCLNDCLSGRGVRRGEVLPRCPVKRTVPEAIRAISGDFAKIPQFNDQPDRTFADVLEVLQLARTRRRLCLRSAFITYAFDLDGLNGSPEPSIGRSLLDSSHDLRIMQFIDRAANRANQELDRMRMLVRIQASGEGIQQLNPMNETMSLKELNRSVDRRRRGSAATYFFQSIQQVVCADGPVGSEDQGQDLPAESGKANAVLPANLSRLIQVAPNVLQ